MNLSRLKIFGFSLAKFGFSSILASLVDILLFTFVLTKILPVFESEIIAGFVGMLINFFLQKRIVFDLKRNQYIAFVMSISFSLVVLFLGGLLISFLVTIPFFSTYVIVAKILVMGCKFFVNYFSKRWIFEKRGVKLKSKKV